MLFETAKKRTVHGEVAHEKVTYRLLDAHLEVDLMNGFDPLLLPFNAIKAEAHNHLRPPRPAALSAAAASADPVPVKVVPAAKASQLKPATKLQIHPSFAGDRSQEVYLINMGWRTEPMPQLGIATLCAEAVGGAVTLARGSMADVLASGGAKSLAGTGRSRHVALYAPEVAEQVVSNYKQRLESRRQRGGQRKSGQAAVTPKVLTIKPNKAFSKEQKKWLNKPDWISAPVPPICVAYLCAKITNTTMRGPASVTVWAKNFKVKPVSVSGPNGCNMYGPEDAQLIAIYYKESQDKYRAGLSKTAKQVKFWKGRKADGSAVAEAHP